MPKYYVRQPNGKIALFSTIVDNWLYEDMSEDEFYELFCERNGKHTREVALQHIDKWTDYEECKYHITHPSFWVGSKVKNYTQKEIKDFCEKTGYEEVSDGETEN